jgi:hypothetical protein
MIRFNLKTGKKDWWKKANKRRLPEAIWVPDPQVAEGTSIHHLGALGRYIANQKPDQIHFGNDWWDFPSLNWWDKDKADFKVRDLIPDICSGVHALDVFMAPIEAEMKRCPWWKPTFIFHEGNHDARLRRIKKEDERLYRAIPKVWSIINDLGKRLHAEYGVRVIWMYLEQIICIDGIHYSHYFCNPKTGKQLGGTVQSKMSRLKFSFTMGHLPGKEVWHEPLSNGRVVRGSVAGSFYLHHEGYHGPQASDYWRGVLYKHEVHDGTYDLMEVSAAYLLRKWWDGKKIVAAGDYKEEEFAWPEDGQEPGQNVEVVA